MSIDMVQVMDQPYRWFSVFEALEQRCVPLKVQFEAIETLEFNPTFEEACEALRSGLTEMMAVSSDTMRQSRAGRKEN